MTSQAERTGDYAPKSVAGFTGTRHGMTEEQLQAVIGLAFGFSEIHHGDCVGADFDMHRIARAGGRRIVAHPPSDPRLRAWSYANEVLPVKPYLDRNRDIVDASSFLIATPAEMTEQTKGGTWYTVRYARSQGKHIVIVWPDGAITHEVEPHLSVG